MSYEDDIDHAEIDAQRTHLAKEVRDEMSTLPRPFPRHIGGHLDNGATLICASPERFGQRIVLAYWGDEYITWVWYSHNGATEHGHYFTFRVEEDMAAQFAEAVEDFAKRTQRLMQAP